MAVDIPDESSEQKPSEPVEAPALSQMGATFAERAAAREKAQGKAVQSAENKSVKSDETKTPRRTSKKA